MCNLQLLPMAEKFKKHDMSVFEKVYSEFERLIDFYAWHIEREDTKSELTLFLLELLYDLDLSKFKLDESNSLRNYIAVCIRNKYILLSKKSHTNLCATAQLYDNSAVYYDIYEDKIAVEQMLKYLTEKQRLVVVNRYLLGFSDQEIAKKLNVERQAVHQTLRRALKILKNKIKE